MKFECYDWVIFKPIPSNHVISNKLYFLPFQYVYHVLSSNMWTTIKHGCGSPRKQKNSNSALNIRSGHYLLHFTSHERHRLTYLSRHTPGNLKSLAVLMNEGEIRTAMHFHVLIKLHDH